MKKNGTTFFTFDTNDLGTRTFTHSRSINIKSGDTISWEVTGVPGNDAVGSTSVTIESGYVLYTS